MVTTRSGEKRQATIDEVAGKEKPAKKRASKEGRKAAQKVKKEETPEKEDTEKPASHDDVKHLKAHDDTDEGPAPIKINRAPVLHLFAACVASIENPSLKWETCLSLGSAVSTVCALAKGRAIGEIAPRDESKPKPTHYGAEKLTVMQFEFAMKDGRALVGETGKPPNEGYLKNKFKDRYEEAKAIMMEALETWKGDEETLAKKAFHFYERFRPAAGWGQSGGLDLKLVQETIRKENQK